MLRREQFHDYQERALAFATKNKKCALWLGLGEGKTATALTLAADMLNSLDASKVLVIAPLRVANTVWHAEVKKWEHLNDLKVSICTGSLKERTNALSRDADIYTINRENVKWLVDLYGKKWPFDLVIIDESSSFKSHKSARWKALRKVRPFIDRMIQLTGTPAANGYTDLWAQIFLLDGGERLGKTYTAFINRFFESDYMGYNVTLREGAEDKINELVKDVAYRSNAPLHSQRVDITRLAQLTPQQMKTYKQLEKEFVIELQETEIAAFNAAALTNKLLQFANGNVYDEEGNTNNAHSAKIDVLKEVIEEAQGEPVLVAYNFKSDLADLLEVFPQAEVLGKDYAQVEKWNRKEIPILLAHPACLHPRTKVLTETRGWVKIIDVKDYERVYDGIEFVNHKGCSYSGYADVIDLCGLTLTPGHKLLVGSNWVEAKNVRDSENFKREALYKYEGDDAYLSEMLDVRCREQTFEAKRRQKQSSEPHPLRGVYSRHLPQHDKHTFLENMAPHETAGIRQERSKLWGPWNRYLPRLVGVYELLSRYVRNLSRQPDNRAYKHERRLLQNELSVGNYFGTTSKQAYNPQVEVSRAGYTSCGVLPSIRLWSGGKMRVSSTLGYGDESRGCYGGLPKQPSTRRTKSHVYDLVDCGPRNRFLVRDDNGDVFISHNSAGHGLQLEQGSSILVWYGLNWSLELYQQMVARLDRQGQKKTVRNIRIVSECTIDEKVLLALENKSVTQNRLIDFIKSTYND